MNKQEIVHEILAHLERELESYARSARAAHAEATDEQSKAENKYDTRGLEASYLARGQSLQVAEVMDACRAYETMPLRDFQPGEKSDIGALMNVRLRGETTWYFLGNRAGGTEILHEGVSILVITPASPLGRQLVGRTAGERFQVELEGRGEKCEIVAVE